VLWVDAWGDALRNPALREISEELDTAYVGILERVIADGMAEGRFTCDDPAAAAWRLACLMDGLGLQLTIHQSTMTREAMLDHARSAAAREVGLERPDFPA